MFFPVFTHSPDQQQLCDDMSDTDAHCWPYSPFLTMPSNTNYLKALTKLPPFAAEQLQHCMPLSTFVSHPQPRKTLKFSQPRHSSHHYLGAPFLSSSISPEHLKHFLDVKTLNNGFSQSDILQHWLEGSIRTNTPLSITDSVILSALQDALIIGLDAEWYEHDSSFITELGVCILDPRCIPKPNSNSSSSSTAPSAWDILAALETHHVRIKPHAHLTNKDLCAGYPENFQFGSTTFASISSVRRMLRSIFLRHDHNGGSPRPVIFLGHAVENDYQVLKQRFGLDLLNLGTIVATLDTQLLAIDHGLVPHRRKIALKHLLAGFGLHEAYLHNAGNDVVATTVAALLMACGSTNITTTITTTAPSTSPTPSLAYADLKARLAAANQASLPHRMAYGQLRFCEKCDSELHTRRHCKVSVLYCEFCASDPALVDDSCTHKTDKCVQAVKHAALCRARKENKVRNAVPCEWCVQSTDPKRYKGEGAYEHVSGECPFVEG